MFGAFARTSLRYNSARSLKSTSDLRTDRTGPNDINEETLECSRVLERVPDLFAYVTCQNHLSIAILEGFHANDLPLLSLRLVGGQVL